LSAAHKTLKESFNRYQQTT